MYQDEFILGFQKQLTDNLSLGVRAIYRDLKAAIDDNCDYATLFNYVEGNGPGTKFTYCLLFNPGKDAVILADWDGDGVATEKTIPGDQLSPKSKRKYTALEFFVQGNWDHVLPAGFVHLRQVHRQHRRRRAVRHRPGRYRYHLRTSTTWPR